MSKGEALRMNQGHLFLLKQTLAIFILYTRYIKIAQTHDELYRKYKNISNCTENDPVHIVAKIRIFSILKPNTGWPGEGEGIA